MTSISPPQGQLARTSTSTTSKLSQLLPLLPAELQLKIVANLPITAILYLATRSPYFRALITPRQFAAAHPDTNSLAAMGPKPKPPKRYSSMYPDQHRDPAPRTAPAICNMFRFLSPTEGCLTLGTFRARLFFLERAYNSPSHQFGVPLALVCYACLATKPLDEFRGDQTKDEKDNGGSRVLKRACLVCEGASAEEQNERKKQVKRDNELKKGPAGSRDKAVL